MHVLISLTYYRPHYSGLTVYAERLARGLVERGHQVTVLTSRFSTELKEREEKDGVTIIRPTVRMRLSKGVIMPSMPLWAWRLLRTVDVVNIHLPQMDAAYIAWMARMMKRPVVMTYHCDLHLPQGLVHRVANAATHVFSNTAAHASDQIITNSRDYAENSRFLRRFLGKMRYVAPPVELPAVSEVDVAAFRQKYGLLPGQRIVGMNARLATEKGVEYLIEAMPEVLKRHPTARVLHVGQYQNVLGEEKYAAKLAPLIERLGEHWTFLGVLPAEEHAAFMRAIEVLALPSINGTESWGMVQVEAMACGTPAVATNLPGVRCPVQETGMGRIVPPRSPQALAQALIDILDHPEQFSGDAGIVRARYSTQAVAQFYEALFQELDGSK